MLAAATTEKNSISFLDLEYAFFGIFDGHGGKEAAIYAKVQVFFSKSYMLCKEQTITYVIS